MHWTVTRSALHSGPARSRPRPQAPVRRAPVAPSRRSARLGWFGCDGPERTGDLGPASDHPRGPVFAALTPTTGAPRLVGAGGAARPQVGRRLQAVRAQHALGRRTHHRSTGRVRGWNSQARKAAGDETPMPIQRCMRWHCDSPQAAPRPLPGTTGAGRTAVPTGARESGGARCVRG